MEVKPLVMVAVPATQIGAKKSTFNDNLFLEEKIWPVKEFLAATNESCAVLLFFTVGGDQGEEAVKISAPEQNEGVATPSYLAAEKHFPVEIKRKLIRLACLTGPEISVSSEVLDRMMRHLGATRTYILSPTRLPELAAELAVHA